MKRNIILIFISVFCITCFGQTISKADAIKIAKKDSIVRIKKIEKIELKFDSASSTYYWLIEEKVNHKRELRRMSRAYDSRWIYAWRVMINSKTGEVIFRETIIVGSIYERNMLHK